ncbi:MAG: hypothetical protein WKF37_22945 [Bryobacteraceae bacterium]
MYKRAVFALLAGAAILSGQTSPDETSITIFPPPIVAFDEVKQVLTLTDTQIEQLRQIMVERDRATQAQYGQLNDKQRELTTLLESGSTDALKIGQLTLEIQALRKRIPAPGNPYRALGAGGPDSGSANQADLTGRGNKVIDSGPSGNNSEPD